MANSSGPQPNRVSLTTVNLAGAQLYQHKGQYGYYTDGATGLIYCINRYYDPNVGRWTSRDPSGLDGGVNVYAYCDGDPVNRVGSAGLQSPTVDSPDAVISAAMRRAVANPREALSMLNDLAKTPGLATRTLLTIGKRQWEVRLGILLTESHHYLPQQFRDFFEDKGIDIKAYVGEIGSEWHRIIHGKLVETGINSGPYLRSLMEDYNGRWPTWTHC